MLLFASILGGSNSSVYKPETNQFDTNTRLKAWAVYNNVTQTRTYVIISKDVGPDFTVTINSPNTADGTTAQILQVTSNSLTDPSGFTFGNIAFPGNGQGYTESQISAKGDVFTLQAKCGTATVIKVSSRSNAEPIFKF